MHDLVLPLEWRVTASEALRLDAALAHALPGLGLRARRRLWEWCLIRVNGKARGPGCMVRPGDLISITKATAACGQEAICDLQPLAVPALLYEGDEYLAFDKPAGLHSAAIAARPGPSLEAMLQHCAQAKAGNRQPMADGHELRTLSADHEGRPEAALPILLTRLDRQTSGIVLAALNPAAEDAFRKAERDGEVNKEYYALVRGEPGGPLLLRQALDTHDRRISRVLPIDAPDPARHTKVTPLRRLTPEDLAALFPTDPALRAASMAQPCTLVRARIGRGARHQIRAHLAHAGYPLLGESLYAPPLTPNADTPLFLHHARLSFPAPAGKLDLHCPCPWL